MVWWFLQWWWQWDISNSADAVALLRYKRWNISYKSGDLAVVVVW